ncbi:MAG TPA: hypothetical protein PKC19_14840 [Roseiflexaceae bacterium]|nr:hypothetical protein [Roseiflexaceae bacterium]
MNDLQPDDEHEPELPPEKRPVTPLLAAIAASLALCILIGVFLVPPLAANIREQVRVESLATAQSLAATARAPTPTPIGAPTSTPLPRGFQLRSGGIGLDQPRWEDVYGEPRDRSGAFQVYGNGRYVVEFLRGRIRYVEREWDAPDLLSLERARTAAALLLPYDFIESGAERIGNNMIVERFRSEELRVLLLAEGWVGDTGLIIAPYPLAGDQVSRIILRVDATPPP